MGNLKKSNIHKVSEYLNYLGIDITPQDIQFILIYEHQKQEKYKRIRLEMNLIYPDINNGGVLGAIAGAVVGVLLAVVTFGGSLIVAALIGASIGWKLFNQPNKVSAQATTKNIQSDTLQSNPGFDSVPKPPSIGGAIPLIFANVSTNSSGGIRVNSENFFTLIKTLNNNQIYQCVSGLCLGKIATPNVSKLLINDQKITDLNPSTITVNSYTNGTISQNIVSVLPDFDKYSQVLSPTTYSTFGITYVCTPIAFNTTNSFVISKKDFNKFNYADIYRIYAIVGTQLNSGDIRSYIEFRLLSKDYAASDPNNSYITFTVITNVDGTPLSSYLNSPGADVVKLTKFIYRTSKKCSRIDLNILAELWKRKNDDGVISTHACVFDLYLNDSAGISFSITGNVYGELRRGIIIYTGRYDFHKITIVPRYKTVNGENSGIILELSSSGSLVVQGFTSIKNGVNVGGLIIFEQGQYGYTGTQYRDELLKYNSTYQFSSDSKPTCQVTSINEIVEAGYIGQSSTVNFKNIACHMLALNASDALGREAPTTSHFIEYGTLANYYIAAGTAGIFSLQALLDSRNYVEINNTWRSDITNKDYYVKNLSNGVISKIISYSGTTVTTDSYMQWEPDHDFVIYILEQAINYFPDVYVYTLIDKAAGLGNLISDKFIDFPSIVLSKKFCINNNFFYEDIIEKTIAWDEWAHIESSGSLLFPTKKGGKFGLIPEQYIEPFAIFTKSNIVQNTFKQSSAQKSKVNTVHINYQSKVVNSVDGIEKFYEKVISILTSAAYAGTEPIYAESIKFTSIRNPTQAKRVAQVSLKTRLVQDQLIEFETGLQGFNLIEGCLIYFQYTLTEQESETSGFVLQQITGLAGSSQTVKLSTPLLSTYPSDYKATVYHLQSGNIEKNKSFTVSGSNITISGLSESLQSPFYGFSGDIIIINKGLSAKTYRVIKIDPKSYSVAVTAVLWNASMLDDTGLITLGMDS
jgi:hypothetical protein